MKYLIFILSLSLSSCSSLKGNIISGAILGSIAASVGGSVFSPNEEDKSKNAFLFGSIGAALGAGAGYYIYKDPREIKKEKEMKLINEAKTSLPIFEFSEELKGIKPKVTFKPLKKYEVPTQKLPKHLKGKARKQYVIEYETKAQTIEYGDKTIQIDPFKAYEVTYE